MLLKKWEELPKSMQCDEVRPYYDSLSHKKCSLVLKRGFDIFVSFLMLIILLPIFLILSLWIVLDSKGGVFYRQERITAYGKTFYIFKFRTMVKNADKQGSLVTVNNDSRVTTAGKFLRGCRLDELPQLINVLLGDMSFVGTRPEVRKYVDGYTPEMLATLLLPAGITSKASINYKDEAELLDVADDVDKAYIEQVLPGKMYYNLKEIDEFSFFNDIKTMVNTVLAVCGLYKTEEPISVDITPNNEETTEKESVNV